MHFLIFPPKLLHLLFWSYITHTEIWATPTSADSTIFSKFLEQQYLAYFGRTKTFCFHWITLFILHLFGSGVSDPPTYLYPTHKLISRLRIFTYTSRYAYFVTQFIRLLRTPVTQNLLRILYVGRYAVTPLRILYQTIS